MADLFGGLGGLMKGLSSFMPQDDPQVKMMNAQTSLSDLKAKEKDLLAEIGRRALETYGEGSFGDLAARLSIVRADIGEAEGVIKQRQAEKEQKEKAEAEARARLTCPSCGAVCPEGTRFCNECGTKLGAPTKAFCPSCGAENAPGTRFCGECGARLGE